MITLVLGGNKSGKSAFALRLFARCPEPRLFVATGRPVDAEFAAQIEAHRLERGPDIPVLEVEADLPNALKGAKGGYRSVLVDSLDFWLYTRMEQGLPASEGTLLAEALAEWKEGELILVSCEAGLGPVPGDAATRAFLRRLGALNQSAAAAADAAYLVAAGLPLALK